MKSHYDRSKSSLRGQVAHINISRYTGCYSSEEQRKANKGHGSGTICCGKTEEIEERIYG